MPLPVGPYRGAAPARDADRLQLFALSAGGGPVGLEPGTDRVAVNARMMEPAEIEGIRIRHFDGAERWTYLD